MWQARHGAVLAATSAPRRARRRRRRTRHAPQSCTRSCLASGTGPGHHALRWLSVTWVLRCARTFDAAVAQLTAPASKQLQGRDPPPSAARPCCLSALWHVCRQPPLWATSRPRGHRTAAAQGSLCTQDCPRRVRPPRRCFCARARPAPMRARAPGVRQSAPARRAQPRPPAARPAAPFLTKAGWGERPSRARPPHPLRARPQPRAPAPPPQRAAAPCRHRQHVSKDCCWTPRRPGAHPDHRLKLLYQCAARAAAPKPMP